MKKIRESKIFGSLDDDMNKKKECGRKRRKRKENR